MKMTDENQCPNAQAARGATSNDKTKHGGKALQSLQSLQSPTKSLHTAHTAHAAHTNRDQLLSTPTSRSPKTLPSLQSPQSPNALRALRTALSPTKSNTLTTLTALTSSSANLVNSTSSANSANSANSADSKRLSRKLVGQAGQVGEDDRDDRERRRQIMLQERRLQKVLKQRSVFGSPDANELKIAATNLTNLTNSTKSTKSKWKTNSAKKQAPCITFSLDHALSTASVAAAPAVASVTEAASSQRDEINRKLFQVEDQELHSNTIGGQEIQKHPELQELQGHPELQKNNCQGGASKNRKSYGGYSRYRRWSRLREGMTLLCRAMLLSLALYEVHFHCQRTSDGIYACWQFLYGCCRNVSSAMEAWVAWMALGAWVSWAPLESWVAWVSWVPLKALEALTSWVAATKFHHDGWTSNLSNTWFAGSWDTWDTWDTASTASTARNRFYEWYHQYHFENQVYQVFDLLRATSWEDMFHVAFVISFLIRSVLSSWARAIQSRKRHHFLMVLLYFVSSFGLWMLIMPLLEGSESEKGNVSDVSHFSFFVTRTADHLKRGVEGVAGVKRVRIGMPRYSVLDVAFFQCHRVGMHFVKTRIKKQLRKEVQLAFSRPLHFHGRLRKLFTAIRWAKFLAPLFGTCNKLRGHISDMIRKKKQHSKSKVAQTRWNEVIAALSQRSKLEHAVLQLQRSYRERRERKAKRRLELMTPDRVGGVGIRVDRVGRVGCVGNVGRVGRGGMAHKIRESLLEEQIIVRSKLERLQVLDEKRKLRRLVSHDERTSIQKHKETSRKLKKSLLLSPKTSFAVGWKYIAISCVALEISQIILGPALSGEMRKMPLEKFISKVMLASDCEDGARKARMSGAPSMFLPAIHRIGNRGCMSSPIKRLWLTAIRLFSSVLVPVVTVICFMDVFITFFTGELDGSGKLVPKPFFPRFILPGIGLQLIVNPAMVEISRVVKRAILHSVKVGPSLCFCLLVSFFPFVTYLYDRLFDCFLDFIERQNSQLHLK